MYCDIIHKIHDFSFTTQSFKSYKFTEKSLIEYCERSELRLHFKSGQKFIKNAKMVNHDEACG